MGLCTQMCACFYCNTNTHTNTHTHTHTHAHAHTHTHTQTHTHESSHTLILQGKKKKLNNLVCEMGAWCMVMTDEQVSQFLRDGEALWELTQTEPCRPARLLHHGKLLHRASQSIQGKVCVCMCVCRRVFSGVCMQILLIVLT